MSDTQEETELTTTEPTEPKVESPNSSGGDLAKIVDKIKTLREMSSIDLQGWDRTTLPAMENAKNNAKYGLEAARNEYRMGIYHNSGVVLIVGTTEECNEFEVLALEMGAVVVDGAFVYRSIATSIEGKLGNERRLILDLVGDIRSQAGYVCNLLGLNGSFLDVPKECYDKSMGSLEEIIEIVRKTIREGGAKDVDAKPIGDTVAVLNARNELFMRCEALDVAEIPVAVVVLNLSKDEIEGFQKFFLPNRPSAVLIASEVKNPEMALKKAAKELAKKLGM